MPFLELSVCYLVLLNLLRLRQYLCLKAQENGVKEETVGRLSPPETSPHLDPLHSHWQNCW